MIRMPIHTVYSDTNILLRWEFPERTGEYHQDRGYQYKVIRVGPNGDLVGPTAYFWHAVGETDQVFTAKAHMALAEKLRTV